MKKALAGLAFCAVLAVSVMAFAASFDGVYKFDSRTKEGQADMAGWWGMMVVSNNQMTRVFKSPDGKSDKYYVGSITPDGEFYKVKFSYAYKPDYVGNEHKNKFKLVGNEMIIESDDGKFKEVWSKK